MIHTLRTVCLLTIGACMIGGAFSQTRNSENGYLLPVEGQIRVLLVFAEADPENCSTYSYDTTKNWPAGELPVASRRDNWFDHAISNEPEGYLTDYYYQAALRNGNYYVLGDYYPEVVTIPCEDIGFFGSPGRAAQEVVRYLDGAPAPFESAHGYGLEDFDLWGGVERGLPKAPSGDSILDVVVIVWRNLPSFSCPSGHGVQLYSGLLHNSVLDTSFNMIKGYEVKVAANFSGCQAGKSAMDFFIREYFHGIYGGNFWHTGSGAGLHTFPFAVGSWSTTSQSGGTGSTPNGWDRFHLGWYHPFNTLDTIAAVQLHSQQGTVPVVADVSIATSPGGKSFYLRDFLSWGDAVRIKMPHINWTDSGDVKNQYLWLEHHQMSMGSEFDLFKWEDGNDCKSSANSGVYAYMQVGKDIKRGALKDVWPDKVPDSIAGHEAPNALANWLFPLPANGRWDYKFRRDLFTIFPKKADCGWGAPQVPIDKKHPETQPNPFTGFSELFLFLDFDEDGKMFSSGDERDAFRLAQVDSFKSSSCCDNYVCRDCYGFGSSRVAFQENFHKKLNIATNPAPVPVYTYMSGSALKNSTDAEDQHEQSYENRTIYLNGLSIDISRHNTDMYKVEIEWNNWDIDQDVRWCGNIVLQNDADDPLGRQAHPELLAGNTLLLDRGRSPERHYSFEQLGGTHYFTEPTYFTMKENTALTLHDNSTMQVFNGSTLEIQNNATLTLNMQSASTLHIKSAAPHQKASEVWVRDGATLSSNNANGQIIVDEGGRLVIDGEYNGVAEIMVRAGGELHVGPTAVIKSMNRIRVEEGGSLYYYPGATLSFGPLANGHLEVAGNLVLKENATLTYEPMFPVDYPDAGFIRLFTGVNIVAEPNTSIELEGTDTSDKVLEVSHGQGGTVDIPETLDLFRVQNGLVQIYSSGELAVPGPFTLSASKVRQNSTTNTGGITVFGQQNVQISQVIFDKVMLKGLLFQKGHPLSLSQCTFKNGGGYGLWTQGRGVHLFGCTFEGKTTGWKAVELDHTSRVERTTFSNNDAGIVCERSSGTVELEIDKSEFLDNLDYGLFTEGSMRASLRCSFFDGHGDPAVFVGENTILNMNGLLGYGHNQFAENFVTIRMNNARRLRLSEGFNDLTFEEGADQKKACTQFGVCPFIVAGTVCDPRPRFIFCTTPDPFAQASTQQGNSGNSVECFFMQDTVIDAHRNLWNNDVPTLPPAPNHYDLKTCDQSTNAGEDITLVDNSPDHNDFICSANVQDVVIDLPASLMNPLDHCPDCRDIVTPDFPNVPLNEAVQAALADKQSADSQEVLRAVDRFHQILTYPLTAPNANEQYLLEVAYEEMLAANGKSYHMEVVGRADNTPTVHVNNQLIMDVQDHYLQQDSITYMDSLRYHVHKAKILRLADKRGQAITVLDDILTWAASADQPRVEYLRCLTQAEKAVLDGTVDISGYDSLMQANCTSTSAVLTAKTSDGQEEEDVIEATTGKQAQMQVYPNPASGTLHVEVPETGGMLKVFNAQGQTVFTAPVNNGREQQMDITEWPSGLYMVAYQSNTTPQRYVEKVMVH